ncbi:GrpB protein [Paenibacillus sp. PDC88]|nr:GrpB protein [Paenibacillus sp. PDC88]
MNIVVKEYDANWVHQFQKEARLIRNVLEGEILEIYHIGSTAVPGLKAKPIIDIMPVVNKIENVDGFNSKMIDIGYEPL